MCYKVSTPTLEQIEEYLAAQPEYTIDQTIEPYFFADGFGFPKLPVSIQGEPGKVQTMQWGLVQHWFNLNNARKKSVEEQFAKLCKMGKTVDPSLVKPYSDEKLIKELSINTLNAKAEEVFNKPSWLPSIRSKRCIIYSTGFYEWRHFDNGKVKIPYYIYPKEGKILKMGGLWASWVHPETAEVLESFAIITTPANQLMSKIHNSKFRMPLLFDKGETAKWLSNGLSDDEIKSIMRPCPDDILKAHTVGTLISSPKIPIEQKNTATAQIEELYPEWVRD